MNKYNNKKVTVEGIKFDSLNESRFYEYLKQQQAEGAIRSFRLQPKYILQDKFKKNGVTYREITYSADFEVIENDGTTRVYDVKGFVTETFALKKKLFEYRYPELHLECITHNRKHGGWITLDKLNKLRKEARKAKVQ